MIAINAKKNGNEMLECKHRTSVSIEMSATETGKLHGQEAVVDIKRPIHLCLDCRVLFAPIEEEVAELHGSVKNLN